MTAVEGVHELQASIARFTDDPALLASAELFWMHKSQQRTPGVKGEANGRWQFFIAGIMQGSFVDKVLYNQDYRTAIAQLVTEHFPEAEIFDPLAEHRQSLEYDKPTGQQVFWGHNFLCRHVDVLIAYLPEASMGTAIEMWEAYRHGAVVISISPMRRNWVVRFLSHMIFADLEEFKAGILSGKVRAVIEHHLEGRQIPARGGIAAPLL